MDLSSIKMALLSTAIEIQQIPAPTGWEEKRAHYVAERFSSMGLQDVEIDQAGNAIGRLKGGPNKPLVISAHLDTVHSLGTPLSIKVNNSMITGPGIGDNSLAIAALIEIANSLIMTNTSYPGSIWFAANVGEEGLGNLKGMKELVDRFGDCALAYLVLEGIGLGQVFHQGLGVKRYQITIQTPGGHSWENFGTPSAIHELARLVTAIADIQMPANPRSSLNVGTFKGGTSINSIASSATIELDLRSESQAVLSDLSGRVQELTNSFKAGLVQTEISSIGDRPSGGIPIDHPLVKLAVDSLSAVGLSAVPGIASTDSNIPLSRGFPSICIGLTLGDKMHTTGEYIETGMILAGLQQLDMIISKIWDVMENIS